MHIPAWLPGEPPLPAWSTLDKVRIVLVRALLLCVYVVFTGPLWPVYAAVRLFRPRPPNTPPLRRMLRWLCSGAPLPGWQALVFRLSVASRVVCVPVFALAWELDALLYGRALGAVRLDGPLFEISAARSGSTQLARYLEEDPGLVAPSFLFSLFPYVWAWRLYERYGAGRFPPERITAAILANVPAPWVERHELEPFRTDSFEMLYLAAVSGDLGVCVGAEEMRRTFSYAEITPDNAEHWSDFCRWLEGVGRRAIVLSRRTDARLFIKGHFLAAAPELARRWPSAKFLTMVRPPVRRIQSALNFQHDQPRDAAFGPVPWEGILGYTLPVEVDYCRVEQAWFSDPRHTVVRFGDYTRDLQGTLDRVYRECLGAPAPRRADHAHRRREGYAIDRSLEALGVDVEALERSLADYIVWVEPVAAPRTQSTGR